MSKQTDNSGQGFVNLFRNASPYVNAHRGRTFVVAFGGEAVADTDFAHLVHDLAILNSLGIRLVLVHGARPQIQQRVQDRGLETQLHNNLRITDVATLDCVKEAVGCIRTNIEAMFSMGISYTPMSGAHIRITSGNFVTARPLGVRDGIDFQHTGEVRRLDTEAIERHLQQGEIVLLPPLGYSPTGEIFNLDAEDVATAAAVELQADKLLFLLEGQVLRDSKKQPVRELTPGEADRILGSKRTLSVELGKHLASAVHACRFGVRRAHLVPRRVDGALLQELFTRDGIGTLITAETYEEMRAATVNDVGGIIDLLAPLEDAGTLVKRSRELLEIDIDNFTVIERDGLVIGCIALYPYVQDKMGEVACLAMHVDYQRHGRGARLLQHVERQARAVGLKSVFLLTTQTAHWFQEKGFVRADIRELPVKRKNLYNYQRNSKIFFKKL